MDLQSLQTNLSAKKGAKSKNFKSTKPSRPQKHNNSNKNYVTHDQVFGGKFSPPVNPPDVTFQPWYRVTLVDPFTGTNTVKVSTIRDQLKKQLDPTKRGFNQITSGDSRFIVQMKISAIQGWNLTGHLISLSVEDFTDVQSSKGGRDQLAGIVDTGSPGLLPKVGFKFPASHRNHVLRSDDVESDVQVYVVQVGASDQGLMYTTLEFRFDGAAQLPTCKNLFEVLTNCYLKIDSIEAHSVINERNTKSIAQTTIDILSNMPDSSCSNTKDKEQEQSTSNPNSTIDTNSNSIQSIMDRLSILEKEIKPPLSTKSSFSSLNDI